MMHYALTEATNVSTETPLLHVCCALGVAANAHVTTKMSYLDIFCKYY